MSARKREPREFTVAEIRQDFELASYWFGAKWCPAVHRKNGGYAIRVIRSTGRTSTTATTTYDYFELDADGVITSAPYGYTKDYRPGRVTDIEAAVEAYAPPQQTAPRISFGGVL